MKIALSGICKSFGDNQVLAGIDLEINSGEVVALLGENGAGKSTLTRIISGAYRPDAGSITIDGQAVSFHRPQDAMKAGIHVIYQEFKQNLFPSLDVATNLFPADHAKEYGRVFTSRRKLYAAATELLASVNLHIDPAQKVGRLRVDDQQMVAIAKAIGSHGAMLIFDEPTAALDQKEAEALFAQVKRLRAAGLAIVYITHRLPEVFALADRLVVLRDGKVAAEAATADITEAEIVTAMVGRSLENFYPKEDNATAGELLTVRGYGAPGKFADLNFTLQPGEVLGIGGVVGSGKEEILRALFGLLGPVAGEIILSGNTYRPKNPARAIRAGLAYLTPDRQGEGLCLLQPILHNITLAKLGKFTLLGFVNQRKERAAGGQSYEEMRVKARSLRQVVGDLSGGNQQKVLFGRWALAEPAVLLLQEPTRGVDVGSKTEIYQTINRQTRAGRGIVMVSSDLPELVAMSDRVIVMREGRPVAELAGEEISQENILRFALGGVAA